MPASRLFRISSKTKNSTKRRFYMNPSYMNHIDIACNRNINKIFTRGTFSILYHLSVLKVDFY